MSNNLSGTSLVGSNSPRGRVENDFYATPPSSVIDLLNIETFDFTNNIFLEPCVGMGHIIETVKNKYPNLNYIGIDLIDRGYKDVIIDDFLNYDFTYKVGNIISNPPFSLAENFIRKAMSILDENGKCCMFLKIQFLEGQARKDFFKEYPPKKIYVFSKRQNPLRNGKETDENGKKWNSTMCFAWFVWEKGYNGKPEIDWI